jgi:hypothetical protein
MSPSRPLGSKIPQELWTRKKPDYGKLRIFGCEAYALVPRDECRKLELRSRKCMFLGYGPDGSFGYRLWDPETHQVVRSSDVVAVLAGYAFQLVDVAMLALLICLLEGVQCRGARRLRLPIGRCRDARTSDLLARRCDLRGLVSGEATNVKQMPRIFGSNKVG